MNDDLESLLTDLGAVKTTPADDSVSHFGNLKDEYAAARERAVVVDRSGRGWVATHRLRPSPTTFSSCC